MKQRMKEIVESFHRYNTDRMAYMTFGIDETVEYDALVVAPSFTPYKLGIDKVATVTEVMHREYTAGFIVEMAGKKIAWVKTSAGAANCLDALGICAELKVGKIVFTGAVGALTPKMKLGDLCTPTSCIAGVYAHAYLKDSLKEYVPFEKIVPDMEFVDKTVAYLESKNLPLKKASVYCTDTVAAEYIHLDEIKRFGTDLIEMETSTLYQMADLMEVPAIALLVVSDNSATGTALVGRTDEEQEFYDKSRKVILPKMIMEVCLNDY